MVTNNAKKISGFSSITLDTLRIIAAITVLCGHAIDEWIPAMQHSVNSLNGTYAHAAVILFFVLSGYVISFTTTNKNRGPRQYAVARLSRLTSVVIPALVITALIQFIVHKANTEVYSHYSRGNDIVRYFLAGTFLNEIWLFSAAPPINGPLWSLSFEFWYYVIFGAWFFRSKNLMGYAIVALACLIAGPKILLMMPIWLMGIWAYRTPAPKIGKSLSWILIVLLLVTAVFSMTHLPSFPYALGKPPLFLANQFVTDWFIGILIAVALWLLPQEDKVSVTETKWVKVYRLLADLTFPVYVLHRPLLVLAHAVLNYRANDVTQLVEVIIGVIVIAGIIGYFLEGQRDKWIKLFKSILFSSYLKGKKAETI